LWRARPIHGFTENRECGSPQNLKWLAHLNGFWAILSDMHSSGTLEVRSQQLFPFSKSEDSPSSWKSCSPGCWLLHFEGPFCSQGYSGSKKMYKITQ
jgi:hypothetical protein